MAFSSSSLKTIYERWETLMLLFAGSEPPLSVSLPFKNLMSLLKHNLGFLCSIISHIKEPKTNDCCT